MAAKRAALYARVSSERQDSEEKVSIDTQISDSEAYCREHGYVVIGRFVDNRKYRVKGKLEEPSGTRSDRPQYKALIEAAYAGQFDVIVAWKEDRLCRGIYAASPLGKVLEDTPVKVELVKETFDSSMFFIKAAIGKIEIDNIRHRVHMGVQGRLNKGRAWDVHRRYGYALDDVGQIILDVERAPWVTKICNWYLEGILPRDIRRRLLEQRAPIPNRKSGPKKQKVPWPLSTIHKILTAPEYWQGFVETRRDGKVFRIPCPPIIDRLTFERIQELRRENQSHARLLVKDDYLCQGLVTCADNLKWVVRTIRWRRKGVLRKTPLGRYACPGKDRHPDIYSDPDCPRSIGSRKLDTFVWSQIGALFVNPGIVRKGINDEIGKLNQSEQEVKQEIDRLSRDLDRLAIERQWIISQARKQLITESDMEYQLHEITEGETTLRKEQEEQSAALIYRERADDLAKFGEKYLADLRDGLQWLSQDIDKLDGEARRVVFAERRRVVKLLVKQIVIHKTKNPDVVFSIPIDKLVSSASTESRPTEPLCPTASCAGQ